jgi:predicted dehydrogenase
MNKLLFNIGIIGTGRVAERHANAIQQLPDAQLWSVASRTLQSAQQFAQAHHAKAQAFDTLSHMLDDEQLHAVIIATPDNLHATQIIAAAKAGKAILVEKPVCLTLESGQAISQAISQHPVPLAIAYHLRWHAIFRCIAQKAQRGEFGAIHHMKLRWGVNFIDHAKWRLNPENGGWCCLSVLGTHLIDLVRWIAKPTCGEVVQQTS